MESFNSADAHEKQLRLRREIRDALKAFRSVRSDGGLGNGRVWVVAEKSNKQLKKTSYMTIHELLDIGIEDLTLAFGRCWRNKLEAGGILGEGLHSWPWLKGGVWVTVLDDGDDSSLGIDTPQNDFKIQSNSEEATKIKGLISDQLKLQAQQRSILVSNDQPAVVTVSSTKQNKRRRVNDTNKSSLMSVLLKSEYQLNGLE
eukprot:CAMPEP_0202004948 /NCGR_PEP_ID=MMETSP0905-20130828/10134_1 /ASSEMBLY_ACC=CAM_ASM_000554 /TAXON_ID=420261 /ORGANISM="Thalassiosira antarctica, Strain CCMP982" /LENGTH=200 /DNA_ID=CAMNT_0048562411 /DNA_START=792 /DNA_END=1391 /DNA_ORIENTATION=-